MNRTIWTCWFQGRQAAPSLVEKCFRSWERHNPGWTFRCLDASSIERYVPVRQYVDLDRQSITAASLSDIVRILLLHEYGGVWVDATLFCARPLDDWLDDVMPEGFFAFSAPAPDRPLSSWFLSARPGNDLVSRWHRRTIEYWKGRPAADQYFWLHYLFRGMCESDRTAAEAWSRVPRLSADGPHSVQSQARMSRPHAEVFGSVDWTSPVFKLSHRWHERTFYAGSLLEYLLDRHPSDELRDDGAETPSPPEPDGARAPPSFASLKVSTANLGDHIQIIAGHRLLARLGIKPTRYIDRDDEIRSCPELDEEVGPVGILLNGWFKTNRAEWPPHPKLLPLIDGFHIRLFQCPELVSDASIEFFQRHQPIGCRDVSTEQLLRARRVDTFVSNCLSLTFPRRWEDSENQSETFVVSRDDRIMEYMPPSLIHYTFVNHYSDTKDFFINMTRAEALIENYRSRAKLIITTLLHCALPAIAMGIPVIVFYPLNDAAGHASDRERFSCLDGITRVYHLGEIGAVDWNPAPARVEGIKLRIVDQFHELSRRWHLSSAPSLGPIAPPSVCPFPG